MRRARRLDDLSEACIRVNEATVGPDAEMRLIRGNLENQNVSRSRSADEPKESAQLELEPLESAVAQFVIARH